MASVDERAAMAAERYAALPHTPDAAADRLPPRRRGWIGTLLLAVIALIVGMLLIAGLARRSETVAGLIAGGGGAPGTVVATPPPLSATAAPPVIDDAPLAREVAAIDRRLDVIDARSQAAVGDADRAEGLLVTFAARRAIERGVALGYLERLLREHFARSDPQAVAAVISAARRPVSLTDLRDGLTTVQPALVAGGEPTTTLGAIRRELSELVVLRRVTADSTAPVDRFERASAALAAGEVDRALAEVARMPGRAAAASWIGAARRYLAARTALDRLEAAALTADPAAALATGAPAGMPLPAE